MISALIALSVLAAEPVRVSPGEQEVLRAPGVTRIAVGDPSVADVTPTRGGELLLLGKRLGKTNITLWTPRGIEVRQVIVDDGKATALGEKLKALVSPSLRVEQFGGHTIIDGTLDSMEEWGRLNALVADDASVKVLARLNPRVLPVVAQRITQAFHKAGLTQARAECVGQTVFLEGSVADEAELKRALLIANALYSQVTSAPGLR
ncbi:MAG: pilus assembly protein N-terminal domain-containing protein [Myxococcota bacterium]